MYRITFVLSPEPTLLRESLNTLLAVMTMVNANYLRAHPEMPPLYKSGVRYREEACGEDDWADISTLMEEGGGDCEDIACARAAELQVRGIQAWPTAEVTRNVFGRVACHTRVRLPNGQIEDPARVLGLRPEKSHSCTGLGGGVTENKITLVLNLFKGSDEMELSHSVLRLLLNALTLIDIRYLLAHPEAPLLYESGVRYEEEPPGREDWQDAGVNVARQIADCEDLASHRVAELIVRYGIRAWPIFTSKRRSSGAYLYHIQVMHPDGTIEDPSRKLGM